MTKRTAAKPKTDKIIKFKTVQTEKMHWRYEHPDGVVTIYSSKKRKLSPAEVSYLLLKATQDI